jgi:DNA-binding CsgD family transcriptional regulator
VAADLWEIVHNVEDLVSRVAVPALVLHRQHDKVVPFELGREIARLLPDARFVPLTGENHPPAIGDWKAVYDAMMTFLKEVESGEFARGAQSRQDSSHLGIGLSEREIEVLRLLVEGKSNPEIAEELFITRSTVQNHVSNILIKTNAANRTEAAMHAKEHGIA